jgi:hypothetical protein
MDRREFVRFLALTAAGAAALPEQIGAFERYYDLNAAKADNGLVAVDEVFISGLAPRSLRLKIDIMHLDEIKLPLGLNAFGGIVRWASAPDQKIVVPGHELEWRINVIDEAPDFDAMRYLTGHISYIDQDGLRMNKLLTTLRGNLG